ncbi:MAG: hypothetical protein KC431_31470, partial [Myxococcales bacterium]|nr:hypothetical protein [Myxococcales bacterium]
EKNRRVEFIIVEQDKVTNVVEIDPETGEERVVESKTAPSRAKPASGSDAAAGGTVKSDGTAEKKPGSDAAAGTKVEAATDKKPTSGRATPGGAK